MIDTHTLDGRIRSVANWTVKAGKALRHFYNGAEGVFWRDSFGVNKKDQKTHPTSTNRSFFALCEYLRFLYEEDDALDLKSEVNSILSGVSNNYLAKITYDMEAVRMSDANKLNMFTDSHLLVSVSLLQSLQQIIPVTMDIIAIRNNTMSIAKENEGKLLQWLGGKVTEEDEVHDFVTLHAIRALDIFYGTPSGMNGEKIQDLRSRIREDVLRSLAFYYSGVSSSFDPAELTFCIALLNRFPTTDAPQLTVRAIQCVLESQAKDGSWPTSRYISYEKLGLLHVASYEVALTLTHLLLRKLYENDIPSCELILPALDRAFELVKSHYYWTDKSVGWANDHTRRTGLVESWATAVVLTFLIHYHDALVQLRRILVLQEFGVTQVKNSPNYQVAWPDMIPAFYGANEIDLDIINSISDPTDDAVLTSNLKAKVLNPVKNDWVHRPQKMSIVFYGPPGTRKTSMAIKIAKALGWPHVILSPPNFLRYSGLEGFEDSAAGIFDNLYRLRRVVVIFDECEDFFKKRAIRQQLESRTVGAFITAGMLPRLQKLHDDRWVIFMLNTNVDLDELDEAVTRLGRFDYAQKIAYPSVQAQIRYVQNETNSGIAKKMKSVLENHQTTPKKRPISFSMLDQFVAQTKNIAGKPTTKELSRILRSLIDQSGPSSLV